MLKNQSKSRVKKVCAVVAAAVVLIHAVHAVTLDRIIEYKEISFGSPDIPAEMNGYRIAFITDTHAMPAARLRDVTEELNRRQIDLLVLGGDFPYADGAEQRSMEILSEVAAGDGIYGVEGNHDRRTALFAAMEAYGIVPLSNSGLYIRENFYLAGVEDLWNRTPDISRAIDGSSPDDFVLLLAHNPDITMLQDTGGVDLILCGHTHGGQITFFGIWAPYFTFRNTITNYGQRFRSGWALSRDSVPVYVSNGAGEYLPRVFARPQVVIIELHKE